MGKGKHRSSQINHLMFHKSGTRGGSVGIESDNFVSMDTEMTMDQENIWRINYFHYEPLIFE